MEEILFTPAALLELLAQMKEFENDEVAVYEDLSGNVIISVNGNEYILDCSNSIEIDVEPAIVETISDLNEEVYEELIENGDFSNIDPLVDPVEDGTPDDSIEGGILKELATTLLVGGAVRMGGAAIKNFFNK